jgi:hypothetical protein
VALHTLPVPEQGQLIVPPVPSGSPVPQKPLNWVPQQVFVHLPTWAPFAMVQAWPLVQLMVVDPHAFVSVPQLSPAGSAAAVGSSQQVPASSWQASPGGHGIIFVPHALLTFPHTFPAPSAPASGSSQHWWVVSLHASPGGHGTV